MEDNSQACNGGLLSKAFEASARRSLTIDVNKYDAFLENSGLSAEQKESYLRAAWTVILAFVELGFEVHPLQEVCGKDGEVLDRVGNKDSNEVIPEEQRENQRGPEYKRKRGLESG